MLPIMGSIFVACTRSRRNQQTWEEVLGVVAVVRTASLRWPHGLQKSSIPKCYVRGWFRCSQRLMVCLVN